MRRRASGSGPGPLVAAAAVGLLAALWTWTWSGDPALFPARDAGVRVSVIDNGFHTDLAVPRAAVEARDGPLADAVRSLPAGDWILIGWGDARFYVDQSPIQDRLPDGARAFFRPGNASVVMLDPTRRDPALTSGDRRATLRLSGAGFVEMYDAIEASLSLTDGRPGIVAARAGDDARFFASHEHFWIGRLCNHWSAGVLNAAGLPVRPFRSILSSEVMATARRAELDSAVSPD